MRLIDVNFSYDLRETHQSKEIEGPIGGTSIGPILSTCLVNHSERYLLFIFKFDEVAKVKNRILEGMMNSILLVNSKTIIELVLLVIFLTGHIQSIDGYPL